MELGGETIFRLFDWALRQAKLGRALHAGTHYSAIIEKEKYKERLMFDVES